MSLANQSYPSFVMQLFIPVTSLLRTQFNDSSGSSSTFSTEQDRPETRSTYLSEWWPPRPFPCLLTFGSPHPPPGSLNPSTIPPVCHRLVRPPLGFLYLQPQPLTPPNFVMVPQWMWSSWASEPVESVWESGCCKKFADLGGIWCCAERGSRRCYEFPDLGGIWCCVERESRRCYEFPDLGGIWCCAERESRYCYEFPDLEGTWCCAAWE